jgi:hypothetical protein
LAFKNSPVYWAFRIYALCTVTMVVLHGVAWLGDRPALHRTANLVLAFGLGIGVLPLVVALGARLLSRRHDAER